MTRGIGEPKPAAATIDAERAPPLSSDGSRIAFIGTGLGNGEFEVCIMNADGTNLVQLTDNAAFEGTMTWSPDGHKVIFQSPGGANPTLFYAIRARGNDLIGSSLANRGRQLT